MRGNGSDESMTKPNRMMQFICMFTLVAIAGSLVLSPVSAVELQMAGTEIDRSISENDSARTSYVNVLMAQDFGEREIAEQNIEKIKNNTSVAPNSPGEMLYPQPVLPEKSVHCDTMWIDPRIERSATHWMLLVVDTKAQKELVDVIDKTSISNDEKKVLTESLRKIWEKYPVKFTKKRVSDKSGI